MTVQLISMVHHQTHVKALELTGWRWRLMSLLCRALRRRRSVARSCSRPRGRPDMRPLSLRAARHPPFSTEKAYIHELLRMNYDAPWEGSFQFRPFAVDVFGAYGDGATAILQKLARKPSEYTSMTVGACKRLAFQSRCKPRTRGCCDRGKL
jgi:hypothetical protein